MFICGNASLIPSPHFCLLSESRDNTNYWGNSHESGTARQPCYQMLSIKQNFPSLQLCRYMQLRRLWHISEMPCKLICAFRASWHRLNPISRFIVSLSHLHVCAVPSRVNTPTFAQPHTGLQPHGSRLVTNKCSSLCCTRVRLYGRFLHHRCSNLMDEIELQCLVSNSLRLMHYRHKHTHTHVLREAI